MMPGPLFFYQGMDSMSSKHEQVIAATKKPLASPVADSKSYTSAAAPRVDAAAKLNPPKFTATELPEKVSVCIYRFPFGDQEHATCSNWLMNALFTLHMHPRVEKVCTEIINDTPVDMSRNRALKHALDNKFDFAVFVDSDMFPDYEQAQRERDSRARPFFPDALNYALDPAHPASCIGVPYCSAPPEEQVLVMLWSQQETNDPDGKIRLDKYTREETIGKYGFEEVAALGTGLLLIPMRIIKQLPPPWFFYESGAIEWTQKDSSEDVVLTRDLSLAGIPQIVYWSAWAGHWKMKLVTRPVGLPYDRIPKRMALAVRQQVALEQKARLAKTE